MPCMVPVSSKDSAERIFAAWDERVTIAAGLVSDDDAVRVDVGLRTGLAARTGEIPEIMDMGNPRGGTSPKTASPPPLKIGPSQVPSLSWRPGPSPSLLGGWRWYLMLIRTFVELYDTGEWMLRRWAASVDRRRWPRDCGSSMARWRPTCGSG